MSVMVENMTRCCSASYFVNKCYFQWYVKKKDRCWGKRTKKKKKKNNFEFTKRYVTVVQLAYEFLWV